MPFFFFYWECEIVWLIPALCMIKITLLPKLFINCSLCCWNRWALEQDGERHQWAPASSSVFVLLPQAVIPSISATSGWLCVLTGILCLVNIISVSALDCRIAFLGVQHTWWLSFCMPYGTAHLTFFSSLPGTFSNPTVMFVWWSFSWAEQGVSEKWLFV